MYLSAIEGSFGAIVCEIYTLGYHSAGMLFYCHLDAFDVSVWGSVIFLTSLSYTRDGRFCQGFSSR